MAERNWAGNYSYRARAIHAPETLDELRSLVAGAPRVRVLGSRHSFTDIADSAELISLDRMPRRIEIDRGGMTVTCDGAVRYGELAAELDRAGLGLANLASLPHISVAGAVSTATHGSGDHNGNLATAVTGQSLVTSDGEMVAAVRGDPGFDGMVVGLGALGAVIRVTLEVVPAYDVRQFVFERMPWETLTEHFDEVMASGYSVSVFSRWGKATEQVWVKCPVGDEPGGAPGGLFGVPGELFGARAATRPRHPIAGLDPVHATPQLGEPGSWSERLPHFRMGFTPSSGAELQSEYLVARRHGVAAIEALRSIAPALAPLVQVSEIRTVAADPLWMSPQYGQATVGIHFTWKPDQAAVERVLEQVEHVLSPFAFRPHWGKLFMARADTLAPRYPRLGDFAALLDRLDPRGAFRNRWLAERLLGSAP